MNCDFTRLNKLTKYIKSSQIAIAKVIYFSVIYRTGINELKNLQYLPRMTEAREYLFEDRTKAHADHVGHGLDRMTTAAVGKYFFLVSINNNN